MAKEVIAQNPELQEAERSYKRDVFLVESQPVVKRVFFGAWLALDLTLVVLVLGYFAYYSTLGSAYDKRFAARAANNIEAQRTLSEARQAQSLLVRGTDVFAHGDGAYDLRTMVENPNTDWHALITYQFVSSQGESREEHGFILPNESRPLTSFRQTFSSRPNDAELMVKKVDWRRIDPAIALDYENWLQEREDFQILDATYSTEVALDGKQIPRSSFRIVNESAYGYWNAAFLVEILRGGTVAATTRITVPAFEAGEERLISVNWFGNVPPTGTVSVRPAINYFDEETYLPPSSEISSDLRDAFETRR